MAISQIDGSLFTKMVQAAAAILNSHKEAINALNVFPVPDGDTGSNMSLTMLSACREMERRGGSHCGQLAQALAQGSLMGARGNSGVILSQLFRGFAHYLADRSQLSARDLARAFEEGVETAYKAVMKPVEGTILTVARESAAAATVAATAAATAATRRGNVRPVAAVLKAALVGAEAALARTPDLLPVLRKAGVVDAGGKGFALILSGYLEAVQVADGVAAESLPAPEAPAATAPAAPEAAPATTAPEHDRSPATQVEFLIDDEISAIQFPYDTELFIRGARIPLDEVRTRLEAMGDCVYVVGTADLAKVHIHTANPGPVLDTCIGYGELINIVIQNMREQHADLKSRQTGGGAADPSTPADLSISAEPPPRANAVVVASGPGLGAIFRSLGATALVEGGQSMNPSTQDILDAIESCVADVVYVLPNNKNIILAAEQAAALTAKEAIVIPSRSIPQGVAALLALQPDGEPEKVARQMLRTMEGVQTGEVTYAVRDTTFGDLEIREGDILGLWNGQLTVTGTEPEETVKALLAKMTAEISGDVITVYAGEATDPEKAEALGAELQALYPQHEVEVHTGGQPLYFYVLSVE